MIDKVYCQYYRAHNVHQSRDTPMETDAPSASSSTIIKYQHHDQRNEKISNKSSFGIIDIADSSTSDRIIVIVDTACFIHDGAYR